MTGSATATVDCDAVDPRDVSVGGATTARFGTARFGKVRFGVGLIGLAAISVLLWSLVWAVVAPVLFGWSPIAVTSGSMEPLIATGDVVFVSSSDGRDLEPGKVIVFEDIASGGRLTHRIVDVTPDGDYVTRGDANGRLDSTPVPPDRVIGVGRMILPAIGLPIVWVERGQWLHLVLALLATVASAWTTRWALLGTFSPWQTRSIVPPTPTACSPPPRRREIRRSPIVIGIALGMLVAVGVTSVQTRAGFVDAAANSVNTVGADTLDPPTALNAAGGATVSLDWTITPDTYADGHAIYRSSTSGGPYVQIATTAPRTVAGHVDSPPAGTYYYVVRASDGSWDSIDSNEASAAVGPTDDYDAVPTMTDNCPTTFNVDQFDTDGDSIGDACDSSPTVASSGVFTSSGQTLGTNLSKDVALADLDGDGDLDAAFANKPANTVWFNDGSGTFTDSGQALGSADSYFVAIGDLDADGDLDLTFANTTANTVWFNDGTGTFSNSGQTLGSTESRAATLGDFDGDGDLDITYANKATNTVWWNNGAGTFTDSGQALGSAESWQGAVGDLDGDGDLDITYANKTANTVWLNDGTGTFNNTGQALGSDESRGAVLADLDGDGDLDIAYADKTNSTVWWNNGTGTFTDSGQNLDPGDTFEVVAGDVDGDGDVDLAYADKGSAALWLNNGIGTFTDSGQSLDSLDSFGLDFGDLDADGDLDIVFANSGANSMWINDAGPAVGLANAWQTGLTHTTGAGSERMLVFVATNEQQSLTAPTLTGVTYGGQPLTFVMADQVGNGCCNARSEIWVLGEAGIAAASGTALAPVWSSAPNTPLYSHVIFRNVEQAAPFGAMTSATVIGDTPNPVPMSPVATSAGDMVLAVAVAGEAGSYSPQNGFTLGVNQSTTTGGTTASGTARKAATGAGETVSMLFNPAAPPWTNRQVAMALVLHAAP